MKKEEKIDLLAYCVEIICQVVCSGCQRRELVNDAPDFYYAANEFYKKGWRADNDQEVWCPYCSKKPKQ